MQPFYHADVRAKTCTVPYVLDTQYVIYWPTESR